ncbi:MAG: glycoside hydrolase family 88 protein [Bacteroidales bacterium]|nr:glycoside hydrolase family 88 protein [Bacteroidales bacterium]
MLRLVNRILDFRKAQSRKMRLRIEEFPPGSYISEICSDFRKIAEDKGILLDVRDESNGETVWADSITGQAPHAWGRAMGWFSMAIVDVLDFIPAEHPGRAELINIFTGMVDTLISIQDPVTGGWYQVPDRSGDAGNYIETSCTAMFAYSVFKAVRMGYLDENYLHVAQKAYKGLIDNFITVDDKGVVTLTRTCTVAGLGGDPYRDGSYEYYIGEETRDNDPKGVGPFILASLEYEMLLKSEI